MQSICVGAEIRSNKTITGLNYAARNRENKLRKWEKQMVEHGQREVDLVE
jgi:hypothetical protein